MSVVNSPLLALAATLLFWCSLVTQSGGRPQTFASFFLNCVPGQGLYVFDLRFGMRALGLLDSISWSAGFGIHMSALHLQVVVRHVTQDGVV